ncbi:hypothetical protein [Kitasatospora sp. NPDC097691]|uniref:hypothetical protein n=1 Tax=Kitasatospora sp. NPDC097691 TaxID=3157231 RepID=UPI00332DA470
MRGLTGLSLAALLVAGTLTAAVLGGARDGTDVIGHRAAPQVVRSADLYFALNDMDARAANLLLFGADRPSPSPGSTAPPPPRTTSGSPHRPTSTRPTTARRGSGDLGDELRNITFSTPSIARGYSPDPWTGQPKKSCV